MQRNIVRTAAALTALLFVGAAMLVWPGPSFAATPGADCGGAIIVGSDAAGKVTLGQDVATCTLTFPVPWPNAPACTAINETNGGGHPAPISTRSTKMTLVLDATAQSGVNFADGDVISYLCVGY